MSSSTMDDLIRRLQVLKTELEEEIENILTEKRKQFQYSLKQGKVRFEESIKTLQRHHKTGVFRYLSTARLGHLLSAPIIYSLLIPFALMDIMISFYQNICFRIYRIPLVERKNYIVIDRQQLAYLNVIEKVHCVYCGYCNGLIEYAREISARTEQYWCPIKHARRTPDPHRFIDKFVDFGDANAYKERLEELQYEITAMKRNLPDE